MQQEIFTDCFIRENLVVALASESCVTLIVNDNNFLMDDDDDDEKAASAFVSTLR